MINDMLNEHPMCLARSIAKLLEADLIATGQVKEHVSQDRLIEILGIELEPEVIIEPEYIKHDDIGEAVAHFDDDELLAFFKKRFKRSEILEMDTAHRAPRGLRGFHHRRRPREWW
jgi:hypothetical protein